MPLQRVVRYYSVFIIYNTRNNWYSLWSTFTATTYVSLPLTVLAVFFHGFKKNFWGKELVGLIRVPLYTLPKAPSPISYSSVTRSPSTSQWSIIKPFFLQKTKEKNLLLQLFEKEISCLVTTETFNSLTYNFYFNSWRRIKSKLIQF